MIIKLATNRRLTLPKDICAELDITENASFEVYIDNGNLVLKPVISDNTKVTPSISVSNNTKIVSNLSEGAHFSRKVYSECGLVIRTKRSYINSFCEKCKGKLSNEYGKDKHPCKYTYTQLMKESTAPTYDKQEQHKIVNDKIVNDKIVNDKIVNDKIVLDNCNAHNTISTHNSSNKAIIKDISKNVESLNKVLDNKIESLSKSRKKLNKSSSLKKHISNADSVLTRVILTDYAQCSSCGQYFDEGFMVDDMFKCKQCAIQDFSNFYLEYLKNKEE